MTDNGVQFTSRVGQDTWRVHIVERVCQAHSVEYRLTKVNHPWTNGQVERMNRTIKEATLKLYDYVSIDQLRSHVHDFLMAYNFAKRLQALEGKTPYEYICHLYVDMHLFKHNPFHHTVGLNN